MLTSMHLQQGLCSSPRQCLSSSNVWRRSSPQARPMHSRLKAAAEEGDPEVQDSLVDMIRLQINKQKVEDFVEEESDKLRLSAEEAKAAVDRLAQLELDRSNLAFDSAIADINQSADEFEEQLRQSRLQAQADQADFEAWERKMEADRSAGHFFKSLYQVDQKRPVGSGNADTEESSMQSPTEGSYRASPAVGDARSPLAFYVSSFLVAVLTTAVSADLLSMSPSVGQDGLYAAMAVGLAVNAWNERGALHKRGQDHR